MHNQKLLTMVGGDHLYLPEYFVHDFQVYGSGLSFNAGFLNVRIVCMPNEISIDDELYDLYGDNIANE